ncbi:hypothetical protein VNO78_17991 [Psophocarpus tetragonolobus]|uniref:Uncharacterized protein n=1 Tax=Psophocarpus tetragonolobus TaxID=3891 RepID=A0AAN9SJ03_PSOTE
MDLIRIDLRFKQKAKNTGSELDTCSYGSALPFSTGEDAHPAISIDAIIVSTSSRRTHGGGFSNHNCLSLLRRAQCFLQHQTATAIPRLAKYKLLPTPLQML